MQLALEQAVLAYQHNEVPVGAVVVIDNQVVGQGFNQMISTNDPSAHAEIIALRTAANNIGNYRLVNAKLYVTLEPCTMCAGSLVHARIDEVIFGAADLRTGAIQSVNQMLDAPYHNHRVKYQGGILAEACGGLLKKFFKERRA